MISFMSNIPHIYCKTRGPKTEDNKITTNNNKVVIICKDRIRVKTLDGSKLCISTFNFDYNAEGGRGTGKRIKVSNQEHNQDHHHHQLIAVSPVRYEVDLKTVHIPPVNSFTTKIDGWTPLPPLVEVTIVPEFLEGRVYEQSRKVELDFKAKFHISIGSSYKAPPLLVDTVLTSEEFNGAKVRSKLTGKRLDKDGKCKLVGVSRVDAVADPVINTLLGLPSECVASLNFALTFF